MIPQFDIPSADDAFRRKRLKVPSACAECRRRKTKCDGAQPCASCIKAKVDCRYVASKSTLKNNTSNTSSTTTDISPPRMIKPEQHLDTHRRPSSPLASSAHGLPNLGSMRSSFSSTFTSRPLYSAGLSRHSFSHYVPQPTQQDDHFLQPQQPLSHQHQHQRQSQHKQEQQGQLQYNHHHHNHHNHNQDEGDRIGQEESEDRKSSSSSLQQHLKKGTHHQQQSGKQRQLQAEQHQQHLKQQQLQHREQARLNVPTIVAIEERLAAIERILQILLEKSETANTSSHSEADNERWGHQGYLPRTDLTYLNSARTNSDNESNGTSSATHEHLRLPPLYNNSNIINTTPSNKVDNTTSHHPVSSSNASYNPTTPTSPPLPQQQSSASFASSPVPPTSSLRSGAGRPASTSTPPATKHINHRQILGDTETRSSSSTPSLQPMITGFKRPHDSTPGQPSPPLSSSPSSSSVSSQPITSTDTVHPQPDCPPATPSISNTPSSTSHYQHNQHSIPY
ncbi:hypothetical protein [Absidia glauca]|uniref:Zn(2)-C6 fungal-type domain-containing protein n=1 Tax=Absidia glauca TaxID=4829 RepID=A0A168QUA0_ABSGL|nr:hypothetical protein [Absidia glauca]